MTPQEPQSATAWTSTWKRRSVEKDVKRWIGWKPIVDLCKKIQDLEGAPFGAIYAGAFLTGGRITEVLELKGNNFNFKDDEVEVINMKLEKHWKKIGWHMEHVTEAELPTNVTRRLYLYDESDGTFRRTRYDTVRDTEAIRNDFSFLLTEPMAKGLKAYVEAREPDEWLYPSKTRTDKHVNRTTVWKVFTRHGIFPHWLRAQRASCLRTEYKFRTEDLMDWFSWRDMASALRYGRMGSTDLLDKFRAAQP